MQVSFLISYPNFKTLFFRECRRIQKNRKKKICKKKNFKICIECKELKPYGGRQMCQKCYQRVFSSHKSIAKRKT